MTTSTGFGDALRGRFSLFVFVLGVNGRIVSLWRCRMSFYRYAEDLTKNSFMSPEMDWPVIWPLYLLHLNRLWHPSLGLRRWPRAAILPL